MDKVLEAFGFNEKVKMIIYQLISTTSFDVMVNGSPSNFFKSTRGLRQGDPLSPILFIILDACLGRLIHEKRSKGELKGIKPSLGPDIFSHQQFMDDTILGEKFGQGSYSHLLF